MDWDLATYSALLTRLRELHRLLLADGEDGWATTIDSLANSLENKEIRAIEGCLALFGGAGSLNDLVLGQRYENGIFSWKDNFQEINDQFDILRKDIFELTKQIKQG